MEQRRTIVADVRTTAGTERRACRWLGFHRSAVRYRPRRQRDDAGLRRRLRELASRHPRWGSPMLIWRLRQEGVRDNHKRIRRLYRLEGLAVRRQRRKRVAVPRVPHPVPSQPNEQWAMDFIRDTLNDGRAFRLLTILDTCTRESPAIEVDHSLGADRVVTVLDRLAVTRGLPQRIVVDNGSEFQSRALDAWAHQRGVQLVFIRPGKPVENAFIESFNGRVRDECLNQHWFLSVADARRTIERWRVSYNTARPHRGLAHVPPAVFAERFKLKNNPTRLSA
jgi:putative transposase